jgi:CubicO group peptidase (beta-lactamase class C family)
LLQKGNWNDIQLLDSAFVERMVTPCKEAFLPNEPKKYGYSIWIDETYHPAFYGMIGLLGQRVLVVPDKQLVIVRFGKNKDTTHPSKGSLDADTYIMIDEVVKMTNELTESTSYLQNLSGTWLSIAEASRK